MFSMLHCTLYECNMCGSNHREESDRRPIALCPECVAKVWWITGADSKKRYSELAAFSMKNGLQEEAAFFRKSAQVLSTEEDQGK
jgi:archaemetzincin